MHKNKSRQARRGGKGDRDDAVSEVICIAESAIDAAVAKIRVVDAKFAAGILHGSYGKQEIVQACYGALIDLERHRLANVIRRRVQKRAGDDGPTDLAVLLIGLALPKLRSGVVSNWACAVRFAQDHRVRPMKVRGFLYVKGGINGCAALYRASLRAKANDDYEDDGFVPRKRDRRWGNMKRPHRARAFFD